MFRKFKIQLFKQAINIVTNVIAVPLRNTFQTSLNLQLIEKFLFTNVKGHFLSNRM